MTITSKNDRVELTDCSDTGCSGRDCSTLYANCNDFVEKSRISRKLVAFRSPGYTNKLVLVILMGVTGDSMEQDLTRKYKGLFVLILLFIYFIKKSDDYSNFSCFERIFENIHDESKSHVFCLRVLKKS